MKSLLLLLPLVAHAAAAPCDPRCDPKAKAKASIAACDPKVSVRCGTTCASGGAIVVTTPSRSAPTTLHVGTPHSNRQSDCCSASVAVTGADSSCAAVLVTSSAPTALSPVHAQVLESSANEASSLPELAGSVRRARAGRDAQTYAEARVQGEEARAELEKARAAYPLAVAQARALAQQVSAESSVLAQSVREAVAQARAQLSAESVAQSLREAASLREAHDEDAFGENMDVQWNDAFLASLAPLARMHFEDDGDDADADSDSADLESRIRALERIARRQGHGTSDGSLEERVVALERALRDESSSKRTEARAPRAQGLRSDGPGAEAPRGLATSPRAYYLDGTGKLRNFEAANVDKLRGQLDRAGIRVAPAPLPQRARLFGGVMPTPPVPSVPPTPPAPPTSGMPPAGVQRLGTPAPSASLWGTRSNATQEERRAIEQAMNDLRSEADDLRAEMQRMREKIDALPRSSGR